jgi:hypothetical protein
MATFFLSRTCLRSQGGCCGSGAHGNMSGVHLPPRTAVRQLTLLYKSIEVCAPANIACQWDLRSLPWRTFCFATAVMEFPVDTEYA